MFVQPKTHGHENERRWFGMQVFCRAKNTEGAEYTIKCEMLLLLLQVCKEEHFCRATQALNMQLYHAEVGFVHLVDGYVAVAFASV